MTPTVSLHACAKRLLYHPLPYAFLCSVAPCIHADTVCWEQWGCAAAMCCRRTGLAPECSTKWLTNAPQHNTFCSLSAQCDGWALCQIRPSLGAGHVGSPLRAGWSGLGACAHALPAPGTSRLATRRTCGSAAPRSACCAHCWRPFAASAAGPRCLRRTRPACKAHNQQLHQGATPPLQNCAYEQC